MGEPSLLLGVDFRVNSKDHAGGSLGEGRCCTRTLNLCSTGGRSA